MKFCMKLIRTFARIALRICHLLKLSLRKTNARRVLTAQAASIHYQLGQQALMYLMQTTQRRMYPRKFTISPVVYVGKNLIFYYPFKTFDVYFLSLFKVELAGCGDQGPAGSNGKLAS